MILVTAATGNVGRELIKVLKSESVSTRALSRNIERARDVLGNDVEIVEGDLTDTASFRRALDGVEQVFLASPMQENMADVQEEAIDVIAKSEVKHVVRLSALGAMPKAKARISRVHAEIDSALKKTGISCTLIQPGFFMQNLLDFAPVIAEDGDLYAPAGEAAVAMIDVRDIAAVAAAAFTNEQLQGQKLMLTGPEAVTYADIASQLSDATGLHIDYVDIATDEYREMLLAAGEGEWEADGVLELFEILKAHRTPFMTNTVEEVLGRPATPFAQFAQDYKEAFMSDGSTGQTD